MGGEDPPDHGRGIDPGGVVLKLAVELPAKHKLGQYVNGVRFLSDGGDNFLDLLVCSQTDGYAKVVARFRFHDEFLEVLKASIDQYQEDQDG